jgi:hypothetical protein
MHAPAGSASPQTKKIAKELFVDEQAENQTAEDGVVVLAATITR